MWTRGQKVTIFSKRAAAQWKRKEIKCHSLHLLAINALVIHQKNSFQILWALNELVTPPTTKARRVGQKIQSSTAFIDFGMNFKRLLTIVREKCRISRRYQTPLISCVRPLTKQKLWWFMRRLWNRGEKKKTLTALFRLPKVARMASNHVLMFGNLLDAWTLLTFLREQKSCCILLSALGPDTQCSLCCHKKPPQLLHLSLHCIFVSLS